MSSSSSDEGEDGTQQLDELSSLPGSESQCSVCATNRRSDEYPIESITSACTHATTDVCRECIRTYIASELSNGAKAAAAMECLVCRGTMSYFDVMRNAASEDFVRYDERVTMESLQNESGFRWCPRPDCPGGQIQVYGDAEPIVTCNYCQQRFCFTHCVPWHTGLTCREYDETPELVSPIHQPEEDEEQEGGGTVQRAAEDDETAATEKTTIEESESAAQERKRRNSEVRKGEAYIRNNAKRCPECHSLIERDGGCKHMICSVCNFEWCWECENVWFKGHLGDDCVR